MKSRKAFLCADGTVLYLDSGGGIINVHMDCICMYCTETYTNTQKLVPCKNW